MQGGRRETGILFYMLRNVFCSQHIFSLSPLQFPHVSAGQREYCHLLPGGKVWAIPLGGSGLHPRLGTEGELPKHNHEATECREQGPRCQGEVTGSQLLKPAQETRPRSQEPQPNFCCRRSLIPKAIFCSIKFERRNLLPLFSKSPNGPALDQGRTVRLEYQMDVCFSD